MARSSGVSSSGLQRCRSTSAVPVADVELHRQPQVHAAPDEEPLQRLVRQPRVPRPGPRPPASARRPRRPRRPPAVRPPRSRPVRYAAIDFTPTAAAVRVASADRTASANPSAPTPAAATLLGHPLQPDDLVRGRARQVAELGRGGDRLRDVAGVHAQRRRPGRPPGTACSPRWRPARPAGPGSRRVRRAAAGRAPAGRAAGTRTRPASRTPSRRASPPPSVSIDSSVATSASRRSTPWQWWSTRGCSATQGSRSATKLSRPVPRPAWAPVPRCPAP